MSRQWIIGRTSDCDLVVNDPAVSSRHCRLTETEGGFVLEDLGSTNGTFVNGASVVSAVRVTGRDRVTLGLNTPMPWPEGVPQQPAIQGVAQQSEIARHAPATTILRFHGQCMVFGRDPNSDQVLDYPMVSRRHARLVRKAGSMFLEDLGSTNGTFLNGDRILGSVKVRAGDKIGLGTYTFGLTIDGHLEQSDSRGNMTLEARGVTVEVPRRRLIENISLTILPSELVGLMGPAGAGKTTLMNALNGYTRPTAGEVLLSGQDLYSRYAQFSTYIGYAPQDDIMHRELTVRQALYYSARLRLPDDYSDADIDRRIREVLGQLGMEATENVVIGSPEKKGISGGQRKRVNLAMELLTDPQVLFLDEPTSGLSSEDALAVMKILRGLADSGKTILLTIHQPGLEVFRLLDNLAIVSKDAGTSAAGVLTYYGPAYPDAVEFFNPDGVPNARHGIDPLPDEVLRGLTKRKTIEWANRFLQSKYFRKYVAGRAEESNVQSGTSGTDERSGYSGGFQCLTLARRCAAVKLKDFWNTTILMAQAPIIATLVAAVFRNAIQDEASGEHWTGATSCAVAIFLLALAALWFGASNAVRDIVGEWAIYRRERMVNLKIPSYVASKFIVLGASCFLQCMVLLTIVYQSCHLTGQWLAMFLLLWLVSMVGVGLGLTLSASARSSEAAIALLPIVLLPMVILGGVVRPIYRMDTPARLLSGVMASRWAFEGLILLESKNNERKPVRAFPGDNAMKTAAAEAPEREDMAEFYFPNKDARSGIRASAAVLFVLLAIFVVAVHLILRARDIH